MVLVSLIVDAMCVEQICIYWFRGAVSGERVNWGEEMESEREWENEGDDEEEEKKDEVEEWKRQRRVM